MSWLQVAWFVILGIVLAGFAALDGYDLGAGFWYAFAGSEDNRRGIFKAIGPFWDGNMVWLVVGGGVIFAAFPKVYAGVFSGMYFALILVLFGLILRSVAIEFRDRLESRAWKIAWDWAFIGGSSLTMLLLGVALGNILRGIPLDSRGCYAGTFAALLNPYSILIGLTGFAMLSMHGALFLALRGEGDLPARAKAWAKSGWIAFFFMLLVSCVVSIASQPNLVANYRYVPVLWVLPLLVLASIIVVGVLNERGKRATSFLYSFVSIAGVFALVATGIFPNLVPALNDPEISLTIANSSSSRLTQTVMLVVTVIGMPVVIWYTVWIHRVFSKMSSKVEDA